MQYEDVSPEEIDQQYEDFIGRCRPKTPKEGVFDKSASEILLEALKPRRGSWES